MRDEEKHLHAHVTGAHAAIHRNFALNTHHNNNNMQTLSSCRPRVFKSPLEWTQTSYIPFRTDIHIGMCCALCTAQMYVYMCACACEWVSANKCTSTFFDSSFCQRIHQSIGAAHDYMISAVNHNFKCASHFFLARSFSFLPPFAIDYFFLLLDRSGVFGVCVCVFYCCCSFVLLFSVFKVKRVK